MATATCLREVAGRYLAQTRLDLLDRLDQRPGDDVAEPQRQQDAAHREGDHDQPGCAVGPLGRLDRRHHVGFGDVDQLVRQPLEAVGRRHDLVQLNLPRLLGAAGADELGDVRHPGREPLVLLPDLAEHFHLARRDELHAVEVVAELAELAQRRIQHPVVLKQKCGRDAVELVGRVVLDLAIGRDPALQLDQLVGLIVDAAQHLQPDGPEHDQQSDDRQERDQKLGLDARRQPRHPADQPVRDVTWLHPGG